MKCKPCGVDYPAYLLNEMFTGAGYTVPICGICALEATNQIHGVRRGSFLGGIAERSRVQAIEHRNKTKQEPIPFILENIVG